MILENSFGYGPEKLSLVLHSTRDPNFALNVKVLRSFDFINFDSIENEGYQKKEFYKVRDMSHQELQRIMGNHYYMLIKTEEERAQYGILFAYSHLLYGLIRIQNNVEHLLQDLKKECNTRTPTSIEISVENWKRSIALPDEVPQIDIEFSMTPPLTSFDPKNIATRISTIQMTDPLSFIFSRYYDILYSFDIPLSYFPKTALSRFRILCENQNDVIADRLMTLRLSISDLDRRHLGALGVLDDCKSLERDEDVFKRKLVIENEHKSRFSRKHEKILLQAQGNVRNANTDTESLKAEIERNTIILKLKLRETQLQCLLLLEVLSLSSTSESEILAEFRKITEHKKSEERKVRRRSLVRRKKPLGAKKIVPTFLGMGVSFEEEREATNVKANDLHIVLLLDIDNLIDKMTLLDTVRSIENTDESENVLGFLILIVMPYFKQRLPQMTRHIALRVKDMAFKSSNKRIRYSKGNSNASSQTNGVRSSDNKDSIDSFTYNIKLSKSFDNSEGLAALRRPAPGAYSMETISGISLKRSKSNIMSKNLRKREVDMSLHLKAINSQEEDGQNPHEVKRFNSFSTVKNPVNVKLSVFGNTRKLKPGREVGSIRNNWASFSQVESTPRKRKIGSCVTDQTDLSTITPSRNKQVEMLSPHIIRSPDERLLQTPTSKVLQKDSNHDAYESILSSPLTIKRKGPQQDKGNSGIVVDKGISSSPISDNLLQS